MQTIDPRTDGLFTVNVTDLTGTPITAATVTATVYAPDGSTCVENTALTGGTAGAYQLTIPDDWSVDGAGAVILGEFTVRVTVLYQGVTRTREFHYATEFQR